MDSLGDSIYSATTISTVTENETVTFTSGSGEVINNDVTVITFFGNGTDSTHSTAFVVEESVNVTKATGVIAINQTATGNYNVTYECEGAEYVTNSTSRSLLPLVLIFFALAIVMIGYVIVVKGFKEFF